MFDTDSEALRQSRPVLLTVFTNKVGSIGLGLVSILLVERGVTTGQGTFALSALRVTSVAATLIGGALSDRVGARAMVLWALALSAVGLGLMPFPRALWLVVAFGVCAQAADSLLNLSQRLLLMEQVEPRHQKESLGWMRMVSNFALIFSYGAGSLGARLGVAPLMVFDAGTSLGAFFVGRRVLPRAARNPALPSEEGASSGGGSLVAFLACSAVLAGWGFFYEMFLQGGAGRLEILHPGQGLLRFSTMMVLNTILCAALSVRATKYFERSWHAIAGGIALIAVGILTATWGMANQVWVFFGMLLISLAEVMFAAVAQYALIRLTPGGRSAGFYYSAGLTLAQCGRIAGAALAFPLMIHAAGLGAFTASIVGTLAVLLAALFALRGPIERLA